MFNKTLSIQILVTCSCLFMSRSIYSTVMPLILGCIWGYVDFNWSMAWDRLMLTVHIIIRNLQISYSIGTYFVISSSAKIFMLICSCMERLKSDGTIIDKYFKALPITNRLIIQSLTNMKLNIQGSSTVAFINCRSSPTLLISHRL